MFKNRKIVVTMDKKDKDDDQSSPVNPKAFEEKAEFVLRHLRKFGVAAFAGLCVYVLLDTHRQVEIAKVNNPTT